jgi:hypothetical protein
MLSWSMLALLATAGAASAQEPIGKWYWKMRRTEYYPLTVGTTWKYDTLGTDDRPTGVTVQVQVRDIEKIAGRWCALLVWSADGRDTQTEHLTVLEDGVYRCAHMGELIDPPVCILKLPPKAGTTWQLNQRFVGQKVQGRLEESEMNIEIKNPSKEAMKPDVVVYAGKAVKVTGKDLVGDKATINMATYYGKEVGPVRQEVRIQGDRGAPFQFHMVLKEFKAGTP